MSGRCGRDHDGIDAVLKQRLGRFRHRDAKLTGHFARSLDVCVGNRQQDAVERAQGPGMLDADPADTDEPDREA
jgi:hypothetical protein